MTYRRAGQHVLLAQAGEISSTGPQPRPCPMLVMMLLSPVKVESDRRDFSTCPWLVAKSPFGDGQATFLMRMIIGYVRSFTVDYLEPNAPFV